jgi:crotonobetainyl-CoA:carnitine CoA-transferase CaiB-like acyl-CoA transferase
MTDTLLDDITILDFTHARAGPWCTQVMSELGAEVIKIERPGVGDGTRGSYPEKNGIGVNYIARNRNKKSIVVDLKTGEGLELVRELVADVDVLVENFGPGVLERLGLGYEYLASEVNPQLVYTSIKGYGDEGPYKDRKGVDLIMQAEGGIMSVTGPEGGPPVKVGQAIGDIGAGLYGIIGTVTALRQREITGEGQRVETNLFGTIVSFMEEYLTMYGITGEDPTPYGTRHQTSVPYELFETADGQMALRVTSGQWSTVVTEILEDESLLEYDTQRKRRENYEEIMSVMRPVLRERTTEEWIEIFDDLGCPCGPLNTVSDVTEHPQAQARDYVEKHEFENVGEVTLHGHPLHFSDYETEVRSGPAKLGQHTGEVLAEKLGLDRDRIIRLHEEEVIYDLPSEE